MATQDCSNAEWEGPLTRRIAAPAVLITPPIHYYCQVPLEKLTNRGM